jgi:hypothetical protein
VSLILLVVVAACSKGMVQRNKSYCIYSELSERRGFPSWHLPTELSLTRLGHILNIR